MGDLVVGFSYANAEDLKKSFESQLRFGGGFVYGQIQTEAGAPCKVNIKVPMDTVTLTARVVCHIAAGPAAGIGVAFEPFGDAELERLLELGKNFGVKLSRDETDSQPAPSNNQQQADIRLEDAHPQVKRIGRMQSTLSTADMSAKHAASRTGMPRVSFKKKQIATPKPRAGTGNIASAAELAEAEGQNLFRRARGPSEFARANSSSPESRTNINQEEPAPGASPAWDLGERPQLTATESAIRDVREMSTIERRKAALDGDFETRVALEQVYGKEVWEPLLSNPEITYDEVVNIASRGALPQSLLEFIARQDFWTIVPRVRNTLLRHKKLSKAYVERLLRLMPSKELEGLPDNKLYPGFVHEMARKLMSS